MSGETFVNSERRKRGSYIQEEKRFSTIIDVY